MGTMGADTGLGGGRRGHHPPSYQEHVTDRDTTVTLIFSVILNTALHGLIIRVILFIKQPIKQVIKQTLVKLCNLNNFIIKI